jgi:8-oxo-dGTP diphosphatase
MLPYKISVLVFVENRAGELLLIERTKSPNAGLWSPIGGKLEMATGESPFECAAREVGEEIGLKIVGERDLHLFSMIAEKAYEARCHWLMFLFRCRVPLDTLPDPMEEGRFGFFPRAAIDRLPVPETDRQALWPIWDRHRDGFVALRADCHPSQKLDIVVEQILPAGG